MLAKPVARWSGLIALAIAVPFSLLTAGCARRLPGPDECHELALRLERGRVAPLGRYRTLEPLTLEEDEEEDPVMTRTTECLTEPYDRELVTCVMSGRPAVPCLRAFQARRGIPRRPNRLLRPNVEPLDPEEPTND
jgi:hypothetical protein